MKKNEKKNTLLWPVYCIKDKDNWGTKSALPSTKAYSP